MPSAMAWSICRRTEPPLTALSVPEGLARHNPAPLVGVEEVAAVAKALEQAGTFTFDCEFASESRYVPDLALIQVSWGDPSSPQLAVIDPLAVDPRPVVELVGRPDLSTVLHAAQGDLALLAQRFGVVGTQIFDTQIAAAFLGLGDQVGYGGLVEKLLGVTLDKAMQYTRWLERPLSPEQLAYALDDVRYLPLVARELETRLEARGRLDWVREESRRLAEISARRLPPEEAYLRIGAGKRMDPRRRAALQGVAAWREATARDLNKPPSWILKDATLVEIVQRLPRTWRELSGITGLAEKWIERHGREVARALAEGKLPETDRQPATRLSAAQGKRAGKLYHLIEDLSRQAEIAPRFVVSRSDCDALYGAWLAGGEPALPRLPLFSQWRLELAGQAALDWLRKEERGPRQASLEL